MARVAVALAACALLAWAVPATAAPTFRSPHAAGVSSVSSGGPRVSKTRVIPFRSRGYVALDYHGDEATGCQRHGLCGVSGIATWEPGTHGALYVVDYREHGRRQRIATLEYETDQPFTPSTTSQTTRVLPDGSVHTCGDATSTGVGGAGFDLSEGSDRSLLLRPLGRGAGDPYGVDPLLTRCAGPLTRDVRAALPATVLSAALVRRGRASVNASGHGSFARHGLAGTVRSTLRLRFGRARVESDEQQSEDLAAELQDLQARRRVRLVTAEYRVVSVSGAVAASFAGRSDRALCEPLDACEVTGTVTAAPHATRGSAYVTALARAGRPRRDVFAAMGLVAGGHRRGIDPVGYVSWPRTPGGSAAQLTQPGGAGCTDTAALPRGKLSLGFSGGRVLARYEDDTELLFATRCPGPRRADIAAGGSVATGSVPLRAFRHRLVTLRLNRGTSFRGRGYRGMTSPDVVVTLRRTGVRERTGRLQLP